MGADILEQLPRWRRWPEIVNAVPFAVLPRPGYTRRALAGTAAAARASRGAGGRRRRHPARRPRPAWMFLPAAQNSASATAIRQAAKKDRPSPASPLPVLDDQARADAAQDTAPQAAKPALPAADKTPGTPRKKAAVAGPRRHAALTSVRRP